MFVTAAGPWHEGDPLFDFELCLLGRFRQSDVEVAWDPREKHLPPAVDARVENHWRSALDQARRRGQELFSGPLCRLDAFEVRNGRLYLSLSPTNYRALQGTSGGVWSGGLPAAGRADGLGVNALVVTADTKAVLVRRSENVFDRPGMLDTGGGHLDPTIHRREGRPDPFAAIAAEVQDEFGLRSDELLLITLLGGVRHLPGFKPELLFGIHVGITFATLARRWRDAPEAAEAASLESIPVSRLGRILLERRSCLTPSGQASLYCAWRMGITARGFLRTPDPGSPGPR